MGFLLIFEYVAIGYLEILKKRLGKSLTLLNYTSLQGLTVLPYKV